MRSAKQKCKEGVSFNMTLTKKTFLKLIKQVDDVPDKIGVAKQPFEIKFATKTYRRTSVQTKMLRSIKKDGAQKKTNGYSTSFSENIFESLVASRRV